MTGFATFIEALSSLLWPILAFWILKSFRGDIAGLISRLKKAKVLGHEFEIDSSLKKLNEETNQASYEAASVPSDMARADSGTLPEPDSATTADVIENILDTASRSPRVALVMLAMEVEKEGREVLASIGKWQETKPLSVLRVIERLDSHYGLPKHVLSSLKLFLHTRNRIVHGGVAEAQDQLSAIDSGVTLYRVLKSLPREHNWVSHQGVRVYSDQGCKHQLPGVKGVILKTRSHDRAATTYRIFPSTQTHFKVGKRVSWEWNLDRTWPAAWYRDPDSGEVKLAWESAGEFVGRHYEDF